MQLNQYPESIANLQHQIFKLDQSLITLNESVKIFEAEIDKVVAFDDTLRNDTQRKAKKIALSQTDADFYKASLELKQTKARREFLDIELELLRNSFSVLKLERREAIARLEVQISA